MILIKANTTNDAYDQASSVFRELYEKVTGKSITVSETDDGVSDLAVIGSDSVNDFLMNEVLALSAPELGIRYGTDDYCIRSYRKGDRDILILAGGRGRSTLYAVYDYFERFGGCRYFWDGDIIPRSETLPTENISVLESPRFDYRGLRYFAHRGLHRFQAEHWSFDDWKRELDWMVKKRLNFFMLRIGMDDVWQRAFPDDVPYPESFRRIEGTDAEGYNDRSDFWTLRYRGELRERILAYARHLDLMYPTDCGTMTHWYSRTPEEFLKAEKPSFLAQANDSYIESDTGRVFDFTEKENMNRYMRLTETMVNEYEKSVSLFHTIGLGERRIYEDPAQNLALKRVAYRRIAENIRLRYPDSKLMLATWDFLGYWSPDEVKELVGELDPERTIFLDYSSDANDPDFNFLSWGIVGTFPWIFGIFHAYESESELRGPYDRIAERLKIAAEDPDCRGMILWPELSHGDPLMLEYLAENAWAPGKNSIERITERFCRDRYGVHAGIMNACWQKVLPLIKQGDWGGEGSVRPYEYQEPEMCPSWFAHNDLWTKLTCFLNTPDCQTRSLRDFFARRLDASAPLIPDLANVLDELASDGEMLGDPFILRDGIDIARTVLGRFMNILIMEAVSHSEEPDKVREIGVRYRSLLSSVTDLLSLTDDFSIYATLEGLKRVAPTNPDFEITLKRNISNTYCVQAAYELASEVFTPEAGYVFDVLSSSPHTEMPDFGAAREEILDRFLNKSLADMRRAKPIPATEAFARAAESLRGLDSFLIDSANKK